MVEVEQVSTKQERNKARDQIVFSWQLKAVSSGFSDQDKLNEFKMVAKVTIMSLHVSEMVARGVFLALGWEKPNLEVASWLAVAAVGAEHKVAEDLLVATKEERRLELGGGELELKSRELPRHKWSYGLSWKKGWSTLVLVEIQGAHRWLG